MVSNLASSVTGRLSPAALIVSGPVPRMTDLIPAAAAVEPRVADEEDVSCRTLTRVSCEKRESESVTGEVN